MKRGYLALSIIASICLLSYFVTSNVSERAENLARLAQAACENRSNIENMVNEWKESRDFFSFFVSHNHLEPIDYRIDSMPFVSKDEQQESCAEIVAYANEIKDLISLSFYNVF